MGKSIEDVIAELTKGVPGLTIGSDEDLKYERIPFGFPPIDKLTGGGVPRKRFTIITGPTNSGKSYLCLQLVRQAQLLGILPLWIDAELSWDADWARVCGVDPAKVLVTQPSTGEEAFDLQKKTLESGSVGLVVTDSFASLVPSDVMTEDSSYSPMAYQARFLNKQIPRMLPLLKKDVAWVAINQIRQTMGPTSIDNMPGGMAQTYFAHLLLQVRRTDWLKTGDTREGFMMKVTMKKTKVSDGEFQGSVEVPFRIDGGIDILETTVREAVEKEIITKGAGAWFKYKDNSYRGLNGLKDFFQKHPEELAALEEKISNEGRVEAEI